MRKLYSLSILFILTAVNTEAQDISDKANAFLNSLSDELREQAHFKLDDAERFNMNYVPMPRKGPTFYQFNEAQKTAALNLLKASLSEEGFEKSSEIMALEKVLRIIENNDDDKMPSGRPRRDPLNYHLSIFGNPAPNQPWGWRFEGHHLSLNFTSADSRIISSTPTFFGTNPGIVRSTEFKGKEVLKEESYLGFALINSMDDEQLKIAQIADKAPSDVITLTKRKVTHIEPYGISYKEMNEAQQELLTQLVQVYIDNYQEDFAADFADRIIKAGYENLHFAWAGSLSYGFGYYYRIQGPMLLIEFDNTQNDANHVHTVVRDLENDYGEDMLKAHYEEHHK